MTLAHTLAILERLFAAEVPERRDIETLLRLDDDRHTSLLFDFADRVRRQFVGDGVLLRGIIEFSSYCRNACGYCGLSRTNTRLQRYRLTDREIEVLVISQPDQFDTGALPSLLNRYDIGVALTNGQPNQSQAQVELETALAQYDVVTVTSGCTVEVDDGVFIEVLHPQTIPALGESINDYPLVLRVTYGEVSFLLPSDLSREGQEKLLEAGVWPLATVLQLPQHGTARSLDAGFLEAVQPQVIIIQADPANRRGDPDPDVLAMLPEDVPIFRTDEQGVVHMWTDGTGLWVDQ